MSVNELHKLNEKLNVPPKFRQAPIPITGIKVSVVWSGRRQIQVLFPRGVDTEARYRAEGNIYREMKLIPDPMGRKVANGFAGTRFFRVYPEEVGLRVDYLTDPVVIPAMRDGDGTIRFEPVSDMQFRPRELNPRNAKARAMAEARRREHPSAQSKPGPQTATTDDVDSIEWLRQLIDEVNTAADECGATLFLEDGRLRARIDI